MKPVSQQGLERFVKRNNLRPKLITEELPHYRLWFDDAGNVLAKEVMWYKQPRRYIK